MKTFEKLKQFEISNEQAAKLKGGTDDKKKKEVQAAGMRIRKGMQS